MGFYVAKVRRSKTEAYGTSAEWSKISTEVIRDANYTCRRCGKHKTELQPGVKLRAHHIIPVSKGGRTVKANLKCLCDDCHELQPGHSHLRKRRW